MRLVFKVHLIPSIKSEKPPRTSAVFGVLSLSMQRGKVAFQSAIERDFALICDYAPEVSSIRWQPFSIQFEDAPLQSERRYTPDYLVVTTGRDGLPRNYLVEVKRMVEYRRICQAEPLGEYARNLMAAQIWCGQQPATEMVVITDDWLASRGIANVKLIQAASRASVHEEFAVAALERMAAEGATFSELEVLARRVALSRPQAIAAVLRLCSEDRCYFDIARPFGPETMLYVGQRQRVFTF